MESSFDLCVVGAGMIGTAAAKHASLQGIKVCLIGAVEPKDRKSKERDIYGAFYDEGRITRHLDPDPVWAELAATSILRYKEIEQQSGIPFYKEVGNLYVGSKDSPILSGVQKVAKEKNIHMKVLNQSKLHENYPYLNISAEDYGLFEQSGAGYINPRNLVKAQITIAKRNGCFIFEDIASKITRVYHLDTKKYLMKVVTETGQIVYAQRVLLATGAFTTFRELLPKGCLPDQTLKPLSTSFLQVSEQTASNLRSMPCIIYKGRGDKRWKVPQCGRTDGHLSFYLMPPIRYPDGCWYIKLGLQDSVQTQLKSRHDVQRWYQHGDPTVEHSVAELMRSLFNGIEFLSSHGDSCVITETPSARPYIDTIHTQLGVAIGGNGYAAKSSDEIGRLAATMMNNDWSSDIPRDTFKFRSDHNSKL